MDNFSYIEIEGTPYEIGFQEGRKFGEKIRESIDCYKEMFMDYSGLEWKRAKALSRKFIDIIREYNADYLEEIRGVADGAGLEFEDILALKLKRFDFIPFALSQ